MVEVVWFKRDLRTADHRPLARAAQAGPVLPLYIVEPGYWAQPDVSARHWHALRPALVELSRDLAARGAPLVVRHGEAVSVLAGLHAEWGITRLHAHEETGNAWTFARDRAVRRFCREAGIPFLEVPQHGVVRGLRDRDLWAACRARFMGGPQAAAPTRLVSAVPGAGSWSPAPALAPDMCGDPQPGSRAEGWAMLDSFLAGRGASYQRAMSAPEAGAQACSRLSVPLSVGSLSVREVLHRLRGAHPAVPAASVRSLVSRLHWHCHFMQKLESEPEIEFRAMHPLHEAARRPTSPDDPRLAAWAEGRTGLPFLDACMRSLAATGWLNFRMRAMAVSTACHLMGLDWHAVGTRLARLFTDYEPGIHWPQTQMQASQTGINTPRIYNPVKQGLEHDPDGRFVRHWVPELRGLPGALAHTPWLVSQAHAPIIELEAAHREARASLAAIRAQPGHAALAEQVYRRHGSRARPLHDDDPGRRRPIPRQLGLNL